VERTVSVHPTTYPNSYTTGTEYKAVKDVIGPIQHHFVHGSYHPPAAYDGLTSRLRSAGFEVVLPSLAPLGPDAYGITTEDDASVVFQAAEGLFATGRDVVLVGHSYGGFISMLAAARAAAADLKDGQSVGRGSFKGIVYISAMLPTKRDGIVLEACSPGATTEPDLLETYNFRPRDDKVSSRVRSAL
jgi:pimeloyl-ACP methyl ester carboxylesterase